MNYGSFSFIIKKDNTVWATGRNNYGQLVLGDKVDRTEFTKISLSDIKNISFGSEFTYILKNDDTLWSCGRNVFGQLGLGNNDDKLTLSKVSIDNIKRIACSGNHVVVLKKDGTIWSTGYNASGQLGLGDQDYRNKFTKINIDNVKQVSCGSYFSVFLKNDGTLWMCGSNSYGQLGISDKNDQVKIIKSNMDNVKKVVCGMDYTLVLKNDGTLWACGANKQGQLGLGDNEDKSVFTKVDIDNIKEIHSNGQSSFVLKKDGTLWTCGANLYKTCGFDDEINRNVFEKLEIDNIKTISCSLYNTMILKKNGELWGFGYNRYGELGIGHTNTSPLIKFNVENVEYLFGEFIEEERYLLKHNSEYYTISDKNLVKITSTVTDDVILEDGIFLEDINSNIDILPDEFSLISNIEKDIYVNGVRDKSQLVLALNDFYAIVQENIDYFKCESEKIGNGQIKLVFSIDGGAVWKSHNGTDFIDLSIEIPMKEFETLSSEELEKWNSAKEEIVVSGINVDVLETLDFNTLDFDKIRFAYVISVDTSDDVAINKNLIWQFDSKGSMQKLKDNEYDLKLHSNGVEFKSLIDTDMVKVNILPNGVAVNGSTDFATDTDIDNMFS